MFESFRRWRKQRAAQREAHTLADYAIPDALWRDTLARYPFLGWLDVSAQAQLRRLSSLLLAQKQFTLVQDLDADDAIFVAIAAQACLPVLALDLSLYGGWREIVVYPGGFEIRKTVQDADGVVHDVVQEASGEAWEGGPVLLAWDDASHGEHFAYNVVIHEFAHKIDMLSGAADGHPPFDRALHAGLDRRAWCTALDACHARFAAAAAAVPPHRWRRFERDSLLDPYAAEDPAEFFAVASETFFVAPLECRAEMPELYALLAAYYRQDPAVAAAAWYAAAPAREAAAAPPDTR